MMQQKQKKLGTRLFVSFMSLAVMAAIIGGIGAYFIKYIGDQGMNVGGHLAPLGDAAMEIKLSSALAHLRFEEYLNGGDNKIDEVWELLDSAVWYCDAIVSGASNDEGTFYASEDPQVQEKMKHTKASLLSFIASAKERASMQTTSAGSDADQQFDEKYEEAQDILGKFMENHGIDDSIESIFHAGQARYLLANGHLFFEEYLSGDDGNKMEDILKNFTDARAHIVGAERSLGEDTSRDLIAKVDRFIDSAKERNEHFLKGGEMVAASDAKFNGLFQDFMNSADEAEELIHGSMEAGLKDLEDAENKAMIETFGVTLAAFILAFILAITTTSAVAKPLKACLNSALALAQGDFSQNLVVDSKNELGALANALSETRENLKAMILKIKDNSNSIGQNSKEFTSISVQLLRDAELTTEKSNAVASTATQMSSSITTVASAAEEASCNISSVTSGAEEMSVNVSSVARSILEMSTAISNVSKNAKEASGIVVEAKALTETATSKMNSLDKASQEIGQVTEVIKRIAEQTNLLALNATIEAASAGDAGKGFAVVASEIKILAGQSSDAAENIAKKIEGVQKNTADAVQVIASVSDITQSINNVVAKITEIMEQQSEASHQISKNVSEADMGVKDIVQSITEVSKGTDDITKNITETATGVQSVSLSVMEVTKSADQTKNNATKVKTSAEELNRVADQLTELVAKFKMS